MTQGAPTLPDQVVAFLHAHIRSVLQLEVLLLVFEAAGETLPAARIAAQMYLSEPVVTGWLDDCVEHGFCQHHPQGYRLTEDGETVKLLAQVATTYLHRPVSVGRAVFAAAAAAAADPRISLAEAFRLRRSSEQDP